MSFFFKSKKPGSGLPSASRKITSADGSTVSYNSLRDGGVASSPASVNTNSSVVRRIQSPTPEPHTSQADQAVQTIRSPTGASNRPPPDMSLYPWSQQRLDFVNAQSNPFPRYGAAVNALASRDGDVYMMGGLINGVAVRGDLWIVEAGSPSLRCYPVQTTAEGPGARVGHASLLVGNAFIVFGGDTKVNENDPLDDTLYLLNTSTKHWSRALPPGPRPAGRYGHTLNILGSKIFVFGGQVEGYFFNDLVAFDLNALQQANSRWETLIQNSNDGGPPQGQVPPARTNHSMVTHNDRLYLFGGTDGSHWFNDVWTYDSKTNAWTLLECIGFIPTPREGHAAALVGDVMYVFGGRTDEGRDLGDLAAFRITTRRWYTFQNMGPAPSPRSGHGMTTVGDKIIILGGEPSSVPREPSELSLSYILDTMKIRYPNDQPNQRSMTSSRRPSTNERSQTPQGDRANSRTGEHGVNGTRLQKKGSQESLTSSVDSPQKGVVINGYGHDGMSPKVVRSGSTTPTIAHPQPPQLRTGAVRSNSDRTTSPRATTPQMERVRNPEFGSPPMDRGSPSASYQPRDLSSATANTIPGQFSRSRSPPPTNAYSPIRQQDGSNSANVTNRTISQQRMQRSQPSVDSTLESSTLGSSEAVTRSPTYGDQTGGTLGQTNDNEMGTSFGMRQRNDGILNELETLRSRNAWFASELALARKAGYRTTLTDSITSNDRSAESFGEQEKPLLEALLRMRSEIARVQESLATQSTSAAEKIAQIQKERDTAVAEAAYNRTRLAAHGFGEFSSTTEVQGDAELNGDRSSETSRRLAAALATGTELSSRFQSLTEERDSERHARQLAEESAESAYKRAAQLDAYKQQSTTELEQLRAELQKSQMTAREESSKAAEASASLQLLEIDKAELTDRLTAAQEQTRNHDNILSSLRDAMTATSDKSSILERKLEHEKRQRIVLHEKHAQLRAEHEGRVAELEATTSRLQDAEEMAETHAAEARKHREVLLAGLGQSRDNSLDYSAANDERVNILQQRLEAANSMVKRNQDAADRATEALRRVEQRVTGFEAYQEQSNREGLNLRKQLQVAAHEGLGLRTENADLKRQLTTGKLDTTALQVQHSALKALLVERGVDTSSLSQNELMSPSSNVTNAGRLRELEQQLDASSKTHDELKASFERREQEANKGWEDKIAALDNDYQSAVKYLKGTERMLSKMKQELQRFKTQNKELEDELNAERTKSGGNPNAPADWSAERASMRAEMNSLQSRAQTSMNANNALEARAVEAEQKVQILLEKVGTTVENYRRNSQHHMSNGSMQNDRVVRVNSLSGKMDNDMDQTTVDANSESTIMDRNSLTLESLANELENLKTQWEMSTKGYGTSDGSDAGTSRTVQDIVSESRHSDELETASPHSPQGTYLNWKARLGQPETTI